MFTKDQLIQTGYENLMQAEKQHKVNLAYNIKKRLLIEMGYEEYQAQDGTGVPIHLLNAIDTTLDMWILSNYSFQIA